MDHILVQNLSVKVWTTFQQMRLWMVRLILTRDEVILQGNIVMNVGNDIRHKKMIF